MRRPLGIMVVYGFLRGHLDTDLAIAAQLGADCVEILPDWRRLPDPRAVRDRVGDAGLRVHSAHGCWSGQSIHAGRVDLADVDESVRRASVADLKQCAEWLAAADGSCLIVHPGGLSSENEQSARRDALLQSLGELADAAVLLGLTICVENMPPGVRPGSRMSDVVGVLEELNRAEVGAAIDTGHANIVATAASETLAAGRWLRSTHVHDNDGRSDTHLPPGRGTVDWDAWLDALDAVGYAGPVMLECIRQLREHPEGMTDEFLALVARLGGRLSQ